MLDEFLHGLELLYNRILKDEKPSMEDFKAKWGISSTIGDVYQKLSEKEIKREKGSFYTPPEIVEFMVGELLDKLDYSINRNVKIMDPSCGGGYFLTAVYGNLAKKAVEIGIENPEEHVLNNNIYGYDLDKNAVMICVVEFYAITGIRAENILQGDFLLDDLEYCDVIIGNPPYMGHKVLTGEYRETLAGLYGEVFSDKADMSYCFIKKAVDILRPGGILSFFTSRYIMEALNGKGIRNFILESGRIEEIVDFYGVRVIKGVEVDNIILRFKKGYSGSNIEFFRLKYEAKGKGKKVFEDIKKSKEIYSDLIVYDQNNLKSEGWSFLNEIEEEIIKKLKGKLLSELCESYQGIITGCDRAFVLTSDEVNKLNIERELIKPWIKSKNISSFKVSDTEDRLIYSNLIDDPVKYQNAIAHIEKYYDRLSARRECKKGARKWYELQWGRDSSIFEGEKIIFPYKASSNRFAIDRGNYFSADIYGIKIRDSYIGEYSYEFLVGVLNSRLYEFYIKSVAKKLGEDMYDYYPNKIMNLRIPEYIDEIDRSVRLGGEGLRDRIDEILNEYFGITDKEYEILRRWVK